MSPRPPDLRSLVLQLAAAALVLQPALALCICADCVHPLGDPAGGHACCSHKAATSGRGPSGCTCYGGREDANTCGLGCTCAFQLTPVAPAAAETRQHLDVHPAAGWMALTLAAPLSLASAATTELIAVRRGPPAVPPDLRPHAFYSMWLN